MPVIRDRILYEKVEPLSSATTDATALLQNPASSVADLGPEAYPAELLDTPAPPPPDYIL